MAVPNRLYPIDEAKSRNHPTDVSPTLEPQCAKKRDTVWHALFPKAAGYHCCFQSNAKFNQLTHHTPPHCVSPRNQPDIQPDNTISSRAERVAGKFVLGSTSSQDTTSALTERPRAATRSTTASKHQPVRKACSRAALSETFVYATKVLQALHKLRMLDQTDNPLVDRTGSSVDSRNDRVQTADPTSREALPHLRC